MRKYTEDEKFMKEAIKQYDVHYFRTLSDVCRSDRAGEGDQSGYWKHECEGRLWRFCS